MWDNTRKYQVFPDFTLCSLFRFITCNPQLIEDLCQLTGFLKALGHHFSLVLFQTWTHCYNKTTNQFQNLCVCLSQDRFATTESLFNFADQKIAFIEDRSASRQISRYYSRGKRLHFKTVRSKLGVLLYIYIFRKETLKTATQKFIQNSKYFQVFYKSICTPKVNLYCDVYVVYRKSRISMT